MLGSSTWIICNMSLQAIKQQKEVIKIIQHDIYFSFENKEQFEKIIFEFSQFFLNYSIIDVEGYYKGNPEKSKIVRYIQISENDSIRHMNELINILCNRIKTIANQECVLYVKTKIEGVLK